MKPVVRHFLASVVRGVYRADEEFSKLEDERGYKRFSTVIQPYLEALASN